VSLDTTSAPAPAQGCRAKSHSREAYSRYSREARPSPVSHGVAITIESRLSPETTTKPRTRCILAIYSRAGLKPPSRVILRKHHKLARTSSATMQRPSKSVTLARREKFHSVRMDACKQYFDLVIVDDDEAAERHAAVQVVQDVRCAVNQIQAWSFLCSHSYFICIICLEKRSPSIRRTAMLLMFVVGKVSAKNPFTK
jgi:hypothetical protein